MRHPIKWRKSSEIKKYPDVFGDKSLWIKVSQKKATSLRDVREEKRSMKCMYL